MDIALILVGIKEIYVHALRERTVLGITWYLVSEALLIDIMVNGDSAGW